MNQTARICASLVVAVVALSALGCGGGGGGGSTGGGGGGGTVSPPAAPTNLTVTRGTVQLSHFTLNWTPSLGPSVTGYNIYRKLESQASFVLVGQSSVAGFVDQTVPPALAFDEISYYVTAVNAGGESSPSNTVLIPSTGGPPPPPFP